MTKPQPVQRPERQVNDDTGAERNRRLPVVFGMGAGAGKEGQDMFRKTMMVAVAASSLSLGACATTNDPYAQNRNSQMGRAATGAAIGAAGGAVLGAVVPGVSTVEGAIAGAVLGGVAGAVINNRQYYRDTRGYCYYVDQYGRPIYDNTVRC